ncbi:hypothetical protein EIP86_008523 [Pleurotus ostreatoroseus]|nr:hypothetical protein EIP86_008523 [Pleurotus ostreatoroseus]
MAVSNVRRFDIMTHVNFCRVSQSVRALYDMRHDEDFWRIQCFMNGLGYVQICDGSESSLSWKKIAFEAIEHVDTCDGVCCGRAQLQKNSRALNEYVSSDNSYTYYDGTQATMLKYITFRRSHCFDGLKRDPVYSMERPYLEAFRPSKLESEDNYEPLFEHPIAFRTFATFPPIKRMNLMLNIHDLPNVQNKLGVTTADVCRSISHGGRADLHASEILSALRASGGGDLIPGWSLRDHLEDLTLGTVAGWFRARKCEGCWHDGIGEHFFELLFQPRKLPNTFEEFKKHFDTLTGDEELQAQSDYIREYIDDLTSLVDWKNVPVDLSDDE